MVVSGTAGTGKSSLAAHLVDAACRRGEKCLYLAFEESAGQIIRNMESIGFHLDQYVNSGLLQFQATRPTLHGLELHLASAHQAIEEFQPSIAVLDPVTNLMVAGNLSEVYSMLLRMIDFLKSRGITTLMTTLTSGGQPQEATEAGISSLIDTWILLRDIESSSERNRGLYIVKSRGMAHSNQLREYRITDHGIELLDVYLGTGGVLTGSARLTQEAKERAEESLREQEFQRKQAQIEVDRTALEAQIAALQARLNAAQQQMKLAASQEEIRRQKIQNDRAAMAVSQRADATGSHNGMAGKEIAR